MFLWVVVVFLSLAVLLYSWSSWASVILSIFTFIPVPHPNKFQRFGPCCTFESYMVLQRTLNCYEEWKPDFLLYVVMWSVIILNSLINTIVHRLPFTVPFSQNYKWYLWIRLNTTSRCRIGVFAEGIKLFNSS